MKEKIKLLVIDDDESIRTQMKWALVQEYDIYLADRKETAMEIMEKVHPPLVVLDLGLPPLPEGTGAGLELLESILGSSPLAKVIVVTGNPERAAALEAVSKGAHDFFTKPIDLDELKAILRRASYVHSLEVEYRALQSRIAPLAFEGMIGSCPGMQEVFSLVKKISTTDVPVLITGESGTGKELVAHAVHAGSIRSGGPFVPINCGAIPENLMESELFGHEKGAFTGAHAQRKGRIELASGGTLFLDEIAELPLQLQVKLLRFLQDFRLERVGGREGLEVDVRVIAATNRDVKKLVAEGRFREDLFYRLAVVSLHLPPLRERGEDKLLLAKSFIQRYTPAGARQLTLAPDAVDAISSYAWPGNVRELENGIRRAITLCEGGAITARDVGLAPAGKAREAASLNLKTAKDELEIRLINESISRNNGNVSKAAEELGLTRPTLYHLIKKHKIMKEVY